MSQNASSIHAMMHRLARSDGRYDLKAFLLVSEAVQFTATLLRSGRLAPDDPAGHGQRHGPRPPPATETEEDDHGDEPETFHVSGQELVAGFERLAWNKWGLLADQVLASWGVRRPADVGEIVFLMVEDPGVGWSKRPCDTREDFHTPYDFAERLGWWPDDEPDDDEVCRESGDLSDDKE